MDAVLDVYISQQRQKRALKQSDAWHLLMSVHNTVHLSCTYISCDGFQYSRQHTLSWNCSEECMISSLSYNVYICVLAILICVDIM